MQSTDSVDDFRLFEVISTTKAIRTSSSGPDFPGLRLKLILFSAAAGMLAAVTALIPALQCTSFHTAAVSSGGWILPGIIIIMNSKPNLVSVLKGREK